jgi:hypothetical protein
MIKSIIGLKMSEGGRREAKARDTPLARLRQNFRRETPSRAHCAWSVANALG